MMKNVLVLGGSGFIGSHVCEKLVRAGYRVSVATRKAEHAKPVMHLPGLTVLVCNGHDEAALTHAAAGMDAVVNLVAILHGSVATLTMCTKSYRPRLRALAAPRQCAIWCISAPWA
jgi:NADH dehydrogenase